MYIRPCSYTSKIRTASQTPRGIGSHVSTATLNAAPVHRRTMEPFIPLGQGTRIDPGELNSYGSLTVAGPSPTSTSNSIPAEHRDVGGGVGLGVGVGPGMFLA